MTSLEYSIGTVARATLLEEVWYPCQSLCKSRALPQRTQRHEHFLPSTKSRQYPFSASPVPSVSLPQQLSAFIGSDCASDIPLHSVTMSVKNVISTEPHCLDGLPADTIQLSSLSTAQCPRIQLSGPIVSLSRGHDGFSQSNKPVHHPFHHVPRTQINMNYFRAGASFGTVKVG